VEEGANGGVAVVGGEEAGDGEVHGWGGAGFVAVGRILRVRVLGGAYKVNPAESTYVDAASGAAVEGQ